MISKEKIKKILKDEKISEEEISEVTKDLYTMAEVIIDEFLERKPQKLIRKQSPEEKI